MEMKIVRLWLSGDVAIVHVKIDNLNDFVVGFCFIRSIDYEALFASQKPLHENIEVTQLDAIARLMAFKCHRNLCRDGFDELLVIIGSILPKGHLLPQNFYYSTKLLSDLKMLCQQIHACPKGCMLFRGEHADTNYCIKCKSSRYFAVDPNGDGQKR
jgi:hypothetical protein